MNGNVCFNSNLSRGPGAFWTVKHSSPSCVWKNEAQVASVLEFLSKEFTKWPPQPTQPPCKVSFLILC